MFNLDLSIDNNNENTEVEILDNIMGSGKTTEIIKWMDSKYATEKFIYVSPLLSEVKDGGRISRDCKNVKFHFPHTEEHSTKTDHLLELLEQGLNVCCTHSLYLLMTNKHFQEIKKQGYTIIIDEELNIIDSYDEYSPFDLDSLISLGCIEKQESDGMLVWVRDDENFDKSIHAYHKFKRHVENGLIYSTKRSDSMMVSQLPIKLFSVAKRTIIITYMFEGNVLSSFLKLKGIKYKPFTEVVTKQVRKSDIKNLITLFRPDSKWVKINNLRLSNTWYTTSGKGNATESDINFISKFIEYFARKCDIDYKQLMYTFPKYRRWDSITTRGGVKRKVIKPRSLIDRKEDDGSVEKCWIATQTRATNDYAHKTHLCHLFNRYPNRSVKAYLQDYGYDVNDDVFAVSELVQWVWRSAIRNNEPIVLCIASSRMKKLFLEWLDSGY